MSPPTDRRLAVGEARWHFDFEALYEALDERRQARGISWEQVAKETGTVASTVMRVQRGGVMEADGVRAMVAWLGVAPEAFVRTARGAKPPPALGRQRSGAGMMRRFDTVALHAALEERRAERELTWQQVAQEIGGGATTPMLTRLATQGRISVELMVAAAGWLGVSIESLTYEAER